MALAYLLDPTKQYQNRAGVNNVDGWLEVFLAGTDDHADVYVNFDRSRAEERIGIDNNGRAVMIVEAGVAYRVEMHEPNGELVYTQEPIFPVQAEGSKTYDVVSSNNSIVVDKTVVGNDTTFDLSVAEDDVNRLDWIRCEGSRLLACSDIYLPVYADGPMEVGSVGVRLGAGKYYHVTAHIRATKSAVSPWYDRVFVELSQKFPTGPDTVITNQSFVVDGSMELVQDFEVSCDTMVESDCELKIEIVGDLNNVTYAVTNLEIHRVYSGVAQGGGQFEQKQADWTETDSDEPSYIKHKPAQKPVVAGSGINISETENSFEISATAQEQVQADWTEYNTNSPAYIKNKPSIPADKVYIFWDFEFNRTAIRAAIDAHKVIMDWDRASNEHRFFTKYEEKVIDGNLCELYHFAHIETDYETPFATTWRLGDMCYIYDTVRQIQYAEHDTKLFNHEVPDPTSADAGKVLTASWNPDQAAGSWSWQTAATTTVDQTYNASSSNAQSGTAVAGALATVNQVPASTSADEDKVLTVNSSGNPVWASAPTGSCNLVVLDYNNISAVYSTVADMLSDINNGKEIIIRRVTTGFTQFFKLATVSSNVPYFIRLDNSTTSGVRNLSYGYGRVESDMSFTWNNYESTGLYLREWISSNGAQLGTTVPQGSHELHECIMVRDSSYTPRLYKCISAYTESESNVNPANDTTHWATTYLVDELNNLSARLSVVEAALNI